jgi:hypothetical protein
MDPWLAAIDGGLKKGGKYLTAVGDNVGGMFRLVACWAWCSMKHRAGMGPHYTAFTVNDKPPGVVEDLRKLTELVKEGKVQPVMMDPRAFEFTTGRSVICSKPACRIVPKESL